MRVSRRATTTDHITRAERSRGVRARAFFGGEDSGTILCHIISSYSGFITLPRRHFTVCDSKTLVHDMMKVLRRSFTARGETTAQLLSFTMHFYNEDMREEEATSLQRNVSEAWLISAFNYFLAGWWNSQSLCVGCKQKVSEGFHMSGG